MIGLKPSNGFRVFGADCSKVSPEAMTVVPDAGVHQFVEDAGEPQAVGKRALSFWKMAVMAVVSFIGG